MGELLVMGVPSELVSVSKEHGVLAEWWLLMEASGMFVGAGGEEFELGRVRGGVDVCGLELLREEGHVVWGAGREFCVAAVESVDDSGRDLCRRGITFVIM
eukprot:jgi/Tetstr1/423979/TSEL_014590.t1